MNELVLKQFLFYVFSLYKKLFVFKCVNVLFLLLRYRNATKGKIPILCKMLFLVKIKYQLKGREKNNLIKIIASV